MRETSDKMILLTITWEAILLSLPSRQVRKKNTEHRKNNKSLKKCKLSYKKTVLRQSQYERICILYSDV